MKSKEHKLFTGSSAMSKLALLLYEELMSGKEVSSKHILSEYLGLSEDKLGKISSYPIYNQYKKASSALFSIIKEKAPRSIKEKEVVSNIDKRKSKVYQYIGKNRNILDKELSKILYSTMIDYESLMNNLHKYWQNGLLEMNIQSEKIFVKNLNKLLVITEAIKHKTVLEFDYKPYNKETRKLTVSPYAIKFYKGLYYLIGKAKGYDYDPYVMGIDRIVGDITQKSHSLFVMTDADYQQLFNDIVGVYLEKDEEPLDIHLKTKTEYFHGLLLSSPLHHSLQEEENYSEEKGYGRLSVRLRPNPEFFAILLSYGDGVEVISPDTVKQKIKEMIRKMQEMYGG